MRSAGVFMGRGINRIGLGKGNCKREPLTLAKLAEEGKHTYWKFSQSENGKSVEDHYIEYIEGEVTIAQKSDKLLSFVNELNIAKCYMYGDLLTKFVFDNTNEKFREIEDCHVNYIGGLGEYESEKLLTEKRYSVGEIETIKMIIGFCNSKRDLTCLFYNRCAGNLEDCLSRNGFKENAELMKYLEEIYYKNRLLNFAECKECLLEVFRDKKGVYHEKV